MNSTDFSIPSRSFFQMILLRFSRLKFPAFALVLVFFFLASSRSLAQWSAEDGGVIITPHMDLSNYRIIEDGHGGAWIAYTFGWIIHLQRVNPDGYMQFEGAGLDVGHGGTNYLLDIAPSLDGDVIVFYISSVEGMGSWTVEAQRFHLDGTFAWENGWVQLLQPTPDAGFYANHKTACTDGEGGAWVIYQSGFTEKRVTGVNEDGSSKSENGIVMIIGTGDAVGMTSDGEGGAFVAWEGNRSSFAKRLLANGQTVPRWNLFPDIGNSIYLSPVADGEGGVFISVVDEVPVMQHVLANGDRPWGDEGMFFRDIHGECGPSGLLSFDDGSLAITTVRQRRSADLIWVNPDGTPHLDDYETVLDSSYQYLSEPRSLSVTDGAGGLLSMFSLYTNAYPYVRELRLFRISAEGTLVWENPTTLSVDTSVTYGTCRAVPAEDEHAMLLCVPRGYMVRSLTMYKILADGRVAGREENVVTEPNSSADSSPFPSRPRLSCYPNPANHEVRVSIQTNKASDYTLRVINLLGQEIFSEELHLLSGNTEKVLNLPDSVTGGMLFVQLVSASGKIEAVEKVMYLK